MERTGPEDGDLRNEHVEEVLKEPSTGPIQFFDEYLLRALKILAAQKIDTDGDSSSSSESHSSGDPGGDRCSLLDDGTSDSSESSS
jgi:hypothetical protein